jgi:hypothetical protein
MKGRQCIFCFVIMAVSGCTSSDVVRISDQSYFPLRTGNYQIYQVSETDILQTTCGTGGKTLSNYQLKVIVTDSAKNQSGGLTYTLHRFTRPDSTQAWAPLDTWTAAVNSNQVIVNESNIIYVPFVFPLANNTTWDGNLYNDLKEVDSIYTMTRLGQPYTLSSGKKFQNTFTVVQSNNMDSIVYLDNRLEVYAPSVGLIYKSTIQLNWFTDPACGLYEVKSGIIYYQSLLSYGHQ